MNPPQTPDNEVATPRVDELDYNQEIKSYRIWDLSRELERELAEKTNEVARLQAETDRLYIVAQEASESAQRKTNEVARLRELLNRAIKIANTLSGGGSRACRELHHATKDLHKGGDVCPVEERLEKAVSDLAKLKSEAALATAPEEPTIKDSFTVEPSPEWRDLGPDEAICEGDEYCSHSYVKWRPIDDDLHNTQVHQWSGTYRFRTRRPLPKQEEMPLDGDIEDLEEIANDNGSAFDYDARRIAAKSAHAIRYLRDEISKLKYMQDQHTKSLHLTCDEIVKLKEAK